MQYDSKNGIGELMATPGVPGQGQMTMFKRRLVQSSYGSDGLREIELLSMGDFGHNTKILRKDQSIISAEKVNSDKEYGVLQAENVYVLDPLESDVIGSYNTNLGLFDSTTYVQMKKSDDSELRIVDNGYINIETPNEVSVLPFISTICDKKKINGLQVGYSFGGGTVFKDNGVSLIDDSVFGTIDNDNNIVKPWTASASVVGNRNESIGTMRFTVRITDTDPNAYIVIGMGATSHKYHYTSSDDWNDYDLGNHTIRASDGLKTIEFSCPGTYYNMYPRWSSNHSVNSVRVTAKCGDRTDTDEDMQHFEFVMFQGIKIPECDITITAIGDGGCTRSVTYSFAKSFKGASTNVNVLYRQTTDAEVYDWNIFNYCRYFRVSNGIINASLIKSGAADYVLFCNKTIGTLGLTTASYFDRLVEYKKLADINSAISIGFGIRIVGVIRMASICIKHKNAYYTAKNDNYRDMKKFAVSNLNIISTSDNSISFTLIVNGSVMYYSFFSTDKLDGNKLIDGSDLLYMFTAFSLSKQYIPQKIEIDTIKLDTPVVTTTLFSSDDNIYYKASESFNMPMITKGDKDPATTVFSVRSNSCLRNMLLEYINVGRYVSDGLTFYMPNSLQINTFPYYNNTTQTIVLSVGSGDFVNILSINSYDVKNDSFMVLPERMEDQYPEIYNSSQLFHKLINIGKTGFVSKDGSMYQSGRLSLCSVNDVAYIYDPGATIYNVIHLVFSSSVNQTTVYAFSELGFVLMYVIEDQIICTPVKISIGVIAVGRNSIWICNDTEAVRIWTNNTDAKQASIKTREDNSTIIAINYDDNYNKFVTNSGSYLMTTDGNRIGIPVIDLKILYVNQFGYVSSSHVSTGLNDLEFIDPSPSSDLVLIDKVGGTIGKLNKSNTIEATFSIDSNQQIVSVGQPVSGRVLSLSLFAKGTGTITITTLADQVVHTTTVNSSGYKRVRVSIDSDFDMFQYRITATSGVKLLQRLIGIVSIKEAIYV